MRRLWYELRFVLSDALMNLALLVVPVGAEKDLMTKQALERAQLVIKLYESRKIKGP